MGLRQHQSALLALGFAILIGLYQTDVNGEPPPGQPTTVDTNSTVVDSPTTTNSEVIMFNDSQQTTVQPLLIDQLASQESVIIDPSSCPNIFKTTEGPYIHQVTGTTFSVVKSYMRRQWCDIPLPDGAMIVSAEVIGRSPPVAGMLLGKSQTLITIYEHRYGVTENENYRRGVCDTMMLNEARLFDSTNCADAVKTDLIDNTVSEKSPQNSYKIHIETMMQPFSDQDLLSFHNDFYLDGYNFIDFIKVIYNKPLQ